MRFPFLGLFSTRRYLQTRDGVVRPGRAQGRVQWVVGRDICLFRHFDLADTPMAERDQALDWQIRRWSPYPETGEYIGWQGASAFVWIWDRRLQRQSLEAEGLSGRAMSVVPESALYPPAADAEWRLVRCRSGVEGQHWRTGRLRAGHWWPHPPEESEWFHFQRAQGRVPQPPPEVETFPLLDKPWVQPRYPWLRHWRDQWRRLLYPVAALWIFLLLREAAVLGRWYQEISDATGQVRVLQQRIAPLLTARSQARADLERLKALMRLAERPPQLVLMARIAQPLPNSPDVRLADWHYEGGTLSFVVKGEDLDPRYYVARYQVLPRFRDVIAEALPRGGLKITLRLDEARQDD